MYKFFNVDKTNWILNQRPTVNFDYDEILELSKYVINGDDYKKRILIYFDESPITTFIQTNSISEYDLDMELVIASSSLLRNDFDVYAYPISSSWGWGTGTSYSDMVVNKGSSWTYSDYEANSEWDNEGGDYILASKSVVNIFNNNYGEDFIFNVKPFYSDWVLDMYDNNGILIKFSDSVESSSYDYGMMHLYSKHTNTIYQPKIKLSWDDQVYNSGSLTLIDDSNIVIYSKNNNLQQMMLMNEEINIKLTVNKVKNDKTFSDSYQELTKYHLGTDTEYSIVDFVTGNTIIPFSNHSKLSCNQNGNYIKLDTSTFNRFFKYKIYIKVRIDGIIYVYDAGVIRT